MSHAPVISTYAERAGRAGVESRRHALGFRLSQGHGPKSASHARSSQGPVLSNWQSATPCISPRSLHNCMLLSGHRSSRHSCEGSCAVRSANAHVRSQSKRCLGRWKHDWHVWCCASRAAFPEPLPPSHEAPVSVTRLAGACSRHLSQGCGCVPRCMSLNVGRKVSVRATHGRCMPSGGGRDLRQSTRWRSARRRCGRRCCARRRGTARCTCTAWRSTSGALAARRVTGLDALRAVDAWVADAAALRICLAGQ